MIVTMEDVRKHSKWVGWMDNWVFVKDGFIYGYAPDNDCLTREDNIDNFFIRYEKASIRWADNS